MCLFAEGEATWSGRSGKIFPATGKMIRRSGATLVTYRLEGAYLSDPRWSKSLHRGRIYGHPVGIYPPEKLKAMSPEEIDQLINKDIYEDAWERQKAEHIRFKSRRRAEHMETALFNVPGVRRHRHAEEPGQPAPMQLRPEPGVYGGGEL